MSWVHLEKINVKYRHGCEEFEELAFGHSVINNKISCPCRDCENKKMLDKDNVTFHLLRGGIKIMLVLSGGICITNQDNPHQIEMIVMTRTLVMVSTMVVSTITVFQRVKNVKPLARQMTRCIGWVETIFLCGRANLKREAHWREPNTKEIYNKESLKMDALMLLRASFPCLAPGASQSPTKPCGLQLERHYDTTIADGGDESTASTRVTLETFGPVTRVGLHMDVHRGTGPTRREPTPSSLSSRFRP